LIAAGTTSTGHPARSVMWRSQPGRHCVRSWLLTAIEVISSAKAARGGKVETGRHSASLFDGLAGIFRWSAGRFGGLALSLQTPISLGLRRDDLPSANVHDSRSLSAHLELVKEAPGDVVAGAKLGDRECLATSIDLTK
jgi:hypothetical protein